MRRIRNIATVIGVLVCLISAGQALADCYHNGRRVPDGTRVGSLVCDHGKWKESP